MLFSKKETFKPDVFLNNNKIEYVDQVEHLGNMFINDEHNIISINEIIRDLKVKSNIIKNEFKFLDSNTKIELFNKHCLSLYGCPIWKLTDKSVRQINIEWRKCCRALLGLSYRTHSNLIPAIMCTPPVTCMIHQRFLNFIIDGLNHDSKVIKDIFNFSLISSHSYTLSNINLILREYDIPYSQIFNQVRIKCKYFNNDAVLAKCSMIKELLHLRDYCI